ncbi:MAG: YndJ family transporter, partial [Planctomycetaceae bacterium]|nr:YndJ family transporter [Planctomycetaceae bacterium]
EATPRLEMIARLVQLPAAVLLVPACALPQSLLAMLLCLPWAGVTSLLAVSALRRVVRRGPRQLSDLSLASGFIFLPIGASWLCLWRRGICPLDFDEIIVLLTSIHFHFAGFILPLLAGWSGQQRPGIISDVTCLGVVAGVPAVAAGITLSKLGYPLVLETIAACGLSLAGIATAGLQVTAATRVHAGAPAVCCSRPVPHSWPPCCWRLSTVCAPTTNWLGWTSHGCEPGTAQATLSARVSAASRDIS